MVNLTLVLIYGAPTVAQESASTPSSSSALTQQTAQLSAPAESNASGLYGAPHVTVEARRTNIFSRTTHYMATHKELIAAEALVFMGQSADAASTVHVRRVCRSCVETNPDLGKHPDEMAIWGWAIGSSMLVSSLYHLENRYAGESADRHIIWLPTIAMAINDAMTVRGNAETAERAQAVQQARARVGQSPLK